MMKKDETIVLAVNPPVHILLADDDRDDRFFFETVLTSMRINTRFSTVENGEKLIEYLLKKEEKLPDVLFLDMNMPRKNGLECMEEISLHEQLSSLPVIIYSTYIQHEIADQLYNLGAYHYVAKASLSELRTLLQYVVGMVRAKLFAKPGRKHFIRSREAIIPDL
ncbi:MAG: response regulator [Chitinophagaceae bacterium]